MKIRIKISLVIVWIVVIFSFSLQPGSESGELSNGLLDFILNIFTNANNFKTHNYDTYYILGTIIRKMAHLTEYLILGILVYVLFNNVINTIILGVLVAIIDESIQLFVPNRAGLFTDVLIDICGMLIGMFAIKLFIKKVVLK